MSDSPLIIAAYASTGSGHRIAAEAVARELGAANEGAVATETLDALEACGPFALRLTDGPWTTSPLARTALKVATPITAGLCARFADGLIAARPAAVVCTHPLATTIAAHLVARGRLRASVISAATDYVTRGLTPLRGVALHCVADDVAAASLQARGVDPAIIAVTGIPVRPQFTVEYDVGAARTHFRLPADTRVVLAVVGSTNPEPYARFKESLSVLLPALASIPDTAVAIVTGQDLAFATELRSRVKGFGTSNVHVFDQVEHMAPLIASADLVLARPAGVMCAECVDTGVPLVLVGPASGPERGNARRLVDAGIALFAEDPRTLADQTRRAATSPRRLAHMREAAAAAAKPFAAADIARHTLAIAGLADEAKARA
ncbi:MAG: glycosyltransferase [Coriobacteriia bacterium]|nr:glycosyltransferase [Coriobacteriia bacterium]